MILFKTNRDLWVERMKRMQWWTYHIRTIFVNLLYQIHPTLLQAKILKNQEGNLVWWTTSWQAICLNSSITRVVLVLRPTVMTLIWTLWTMDQHLIMRVADLIPMIMTITRRASTWAPNNPMPATRFRQEAIMLSSRWKQKIMTKSHTISVIAP